MEAMMKKNGWWLWCICLVLAACGGTTDPIPPEEVATATLDTDVDDARADSPGTWQVKTTGMTMWVDTVLEPHVERGVTVWMMRGRVSKTASGFRAYTASGYHMQGKMVSARKFEVRLSRKEVLDLVGGKRLYLDFFARRGDTPIYHGMVRFGTRFTNWAGSNSIYVYRAVNPVIVGDQLKFRGRASTRDGYQLNLVYTDDDAGPALFDDAPKKYHFDWSPAALHLAADPPTDPVYFRGEDVATTPVEKTASLEFRLIQMGIGTEAPLSAWPPPRCEREVHACLNELESSDTEACGWANEVRPCLDDVSLPLAADPARFVVDLKDAVREWYDLHREDVRAMGGRTLEAALRAIHVDGVGVVDGEDGELFGYDPDHFEIFFYADTVFPGSDRVWYGVYDHAGTLVHIEAVN